MPALCFMARLPKWFIVVYHDGGIIWVELTTGQGTDQSWFQISADSDIYGNVISDFVVLW